MDELKGMRAMLATPTYGPVDPFCQKALRVAMMTASNHGLWWAGDVSADKSDFGTARNQAAQACYDHPADTDGILWIDSDIVCEPDTILKLLGDARRNNVEFLSGVYHKKAPPYEPVIYWYNKDLDAYYLIENYEGNFVSPAGPDGGACGFGLVWTATSVIQAIKHNEAHWDEWGKWFPDTRHMPKGWRSHDGRPGLGEDFNFCDKARMAGVRLHIDTGCSVGHRGDGTVYDKAMYQKWLDEHGGHFKPPDPEAWRG